MRSASRGAQRGMALLVAILLVALGTMLAAAMAYENAMTARRGAATYSFDEALLVQQGAEALAAFGLREVWRSDQQYTYTNQGWAKPWVRSKLCRASCSRHRWRTCRGVSISTTS